MGAFNSKSQTTHVKTHHGEQVDKYAVFKSFMKEYYDIVPHTNLVQEHCYVSLYSLSAAFYSYLYCVLKFHDRGRYFFADDVYKMIKTFINDETVNPDKVIDVWGYTTGFESPLKYHGTFVSGIRLKKQPLYEPPTVFEYTTSTQMTKSVDEVGQQAVVTQTPQSVDNALAKQRKANHIEEEMEQISREKESLFKTFEEALQKKEDYPVLIDMFRQLKTLLHAENDYGDIIKEM